MTKTKIVNNTQDSISKEVWTNKNLHYGTIRTNLIREEKKENITYKGLITRFGDINQRIGNIYNNVKFYDASREKYNSIIRINPINDQDNKYYINKDRNKNHQVHEIDMTTKNKKNINSQQNRDGCKIDFKEYRNININNNNANIRNYERKNENNLNRKKLENKGKQNNISKIETQNKNVKIFLTKRGKKQNNKIEESIKTKKDSNINYKKDNSSTIHKNVLKINNSRNSISIINILPKLNSNKKNVLNNINKKKPENIRKNLIVKNENFLLPKEEKKKCFNILEVENYEYFVVKGKEEKKKILEQKLI